MTRSELEDLSLEDTALVAVHVQRGFDDERWGERNNPDAERHVGALLGAWRNDWGSVIHVRYDAREPSSPLRADRSGNEFTTWTTPRDGEPVVATSTHDGFAGTDLAERLHQRGVEHPIFVGFTTDRSVSTTVRRAATLGFEPAVVADATVAFDREFDGTRYVAEQTHRLALAQLSGAYATVVETATLLAAVEKGD